MGCGVSQDKVSPAEHSSKFPQNVLVLYGESRSRKFVDLSGNLKEDIQILPEESVWNYDTEVWKKLLSLVEQYSKIVFVIDVLSVEFFYLDQQIVMLTMDANNNKINQDKFIYLFVTPTSKTQQGYRGPAGWCFKAAFCTLVQQANDAACFIDRGVWYKQNLEGKKQIAAQCIQRLIQIVQDPSIDNEHRHCFYPNGLETFHNMRELYENIYYEIWERRKFVFHIIFQSHQESIIEFCLELYQAQVMSKDYQNPLQTQEFNLSILNNANAMTSVLSYPRHTKYVIPFGQKSREVSKMIPNAKVTTYKDILENEKQGLKNFMYLIDLSLTIEEAQDILRSQFLDIYLDDTHMFVILLPKNQQDWPLLLPIILSAIKSSQICIFLNETGPNNLEFLNLLINSECSFTELNMHLCPYPRLHFYVPAQNSQSLVTLPDTNSPLDLKEASSIGGAIQFGTQDLIIPDPKALSQKQYLNNFIRVPTANSLEGYQLFHSSQISAILKLMGALDPQIAVEGCESKWKDIISILEIDWIEASSQLTELYKDYLYAFYNFEQDDDNQQLMMDSQGSVQQLAN